MIISASRRTDIPALYPEWFMNRLRAGEVLVPNPYNRKKVSRILLSPDTVDLVVFWTKNPEPMIPYLREMDELGYSYSFQMTITDYEEDLEPGVPGMAESMATYLLLADQIGHDRMSWRFDPILLNDKYTIDYHADHFDTMCQWMKKATNRCTISFVDAYKEARFPELEPEEIEEVGKRLARIAHGYGIMLETCAEKVNLAKYGISHGACLDKNRIQDLLGYNLDIKRDTGQRPQCKCVQSVDIGMYDTCIHGCKYCYATSRLDVAKSRHEQHDPNSPMLIGHLKGDEVITDRELTSSKDYQMSLFDLM